jgi:pilus assembly protein CpaF
LKKAVIDAALGLGPLEDLLADGDVTEIMVNGPQKIYVERKGRLEKSGKSFLSRNEIQTAIERIVGPIGRRIDESSPYVDARLQDGSRVHAIIPPLALDSPTITIRKFPKKRITVEDLVGFGSMSQPMANFLRVCVLAEKNMVISGGTGSGKTTLLNVLGSFIPDGERIVTIEDSAELRLPQEHVVRLETRPANIEGKGDVTIRDLVRNALRMRPNRVVVGECRGGEALDMLQAMNTGHDGSLTTLHANTPDDAVRRLENLVLYAGTDLPLRAIRELIFSAVHIIVQISRFSDGTRKLASIAEIASMHDGDIRLQEIFSYRRKGISDEGRILGQYSATGVIPTFVEELRQAGMEVDMAMFVPTVED